MRKRIYIETTVPSFYYEVRKEPEMVARRNWTRQWWDHESRKYELVTSESVLEELNEGVYPNKKEILGLMDRIPLVTADEGIIEIVGVYIAHKVMPKNPTGDALHLALASYHKCDFLLTWNCNHLANANKFIHIRSVNAILGLLTPSLITPLEMLGG